MCKKIRIFSVEKRSFCFQRSVSFTTIVEFTWKSSPHNTCQFGRSRSGKYREIRSTYSDFLFAVYFNEHNFYTLRFLRFAVNRPLMVYQNFKFRCVYKGLNATKYCCTFCKARIHTLLSLELMSTPISTVLRNWVEIYLSIICHRCIPTI